MAYTYDSDDCISLPAGADLSTKQFRAVKVNSSAQAVVAGAGEFAIGILQNKPAAGQAATITYSGVSKAILGGSVTAGATVASDGNGAFVDATEARTNTSDAGASADPLIGSNIMGVALAGGVTGDIVPVLILVAGATPTTAA